MRGDQSARQWRVIRAIEASPNGLTVTEIAKREETGICMICRTLETFQAAAISLQAERVQRANLWAFIDTFNTLPIINRSRTKKRDIARYRRFSALPEHYYPKGGPVPCA